MPKASPIQSNFVSGEFGPKLNGRVDAERYRQGLATCLNYIPAIQGNLDRRTGTKHCRFTSTGGAKVRLIPFIYSQGDSFAVEIGTLSGRSYFRFYKNKLPILEATMTITAITQANPAVVTSAGHGFNDDDEIEIASVVGMTQLNGRRFKVANKTANTFELKTVQGTNINSTSYTAYSSGGTAARVYTVTRTTPTYVGGWTDDELEEIQYAQTGNNLFLVHKNYLPVQVVRGFNDTDWTTYNFNGAASSSAVLDSLGPFVSGASTTTITPSAVTGIGITITASAATFASTDVGVVIGHKNGTTWGYAVITAYTSTTQVTANVISNFGAAVASSTWNWTAWSATKGYPSAITLHQDRLFFAGIPSYPQTIFGSVVGSYKDFTPNGTSDVDSVAFTLNSEDSNKVSWIASDEKGLLAGTQANEWAIAGSDAGLVITPTSVYAKKSGKYGSAELQPARLGKAAIYVQKSQRKVREYTFFYDVAGFKSVDLTELASHIGESGIILIAAQTEPQPIVWGVRTDGVLIAMTYDRDSENLRAGWSRHILGGQSTSGGADPVVESVAVIPAASGSYDEVWLSVKRYINGNTVRSVEYLEKPFDDEDAQADGYFLDCGASYDGSAATTISGLWHLEGETVDVCADGAVQTSKTVASGSITLDQAASVVHVGYNYDSDGQMLRLEAGAADGTSIGKIRRTHRVGFMLHRTAAFKIGPDFDNLDQLTFRSASDNASEAVPLFTGIISENFPANYDFENQICWRQDQPLPCSILAVMPQLVEQDG